MSHYLCSSQQTPIQLGAEDARLIGRREFLWRFGGGLGGIAPPDFCQGFLTNRMRVGASASGTSVSVTPSSSFVPGRSCHF